jgi:predicted Zn-dependent protease
VAKRRSAPASDGPPMSKAEADRFNAALRLARARDFDVAGRELAPLAAARPDHPAVVTLTCQISAFKDEPGLEDLAACARGANRPDATADARMALAQLRSKTGDQPGAIADLRFAQAKLEADRGAAKDSWSHLAHLYAQTWCLSWAEAAAERGDPKEAAELRGYLTRLRRQMGLPREKAVVAPEKESELVEALDAVMKDADGKKLDRALTRAQALVKDYPGAAGPLAMTCEVQLRAGRSDAARKTCERAVAADPELYRAHFLLGFMGRTAAEVAAHYRKSIALDEAFAEKAREDYRRRFGKDL